MAFEPSHAPEAEHEVALVEDHDKVVELPIYAVVGSALMLAVGFGGGGGVYGSSPPPPPPPPPQEEIKKITANKYEKFINLYLYICNP